MKTILLFFLFLAIAHALPTPPEVWKDFNPDEGDFNEEVLSEATANGVYARESFISAYVNEQEIRVYCKYQVKEELRGKEKSAPALMDVHGWMGSPNPSRDYVNEGWAVMSHDYCGQTGERSLYTKYPASLMHCNMDREHGGNVRAHRLDRKTSIENPTESSDYVWYAIQRRVLSYLLMQKEADASRVGARGYSYGGTLMWNMAMDKRVKAVVAFFGVGYLEYYRNKSVWLYSNPPVETEKSAGDALYLSSLAPQAHAPYIKAACLWLSGTNDHHGGHERSEQMFHAFPQDTPWNFALNARGHHSTDGIIQNDMMWLKKHVLQKEISWPDRPQSNIKLSKEGVPEYHLTPASPEKVKEVKGYYALKNPVSFARHWRDAELRKEGDAYVFSMPVMNVDDYVFGFANVTYESTIVVTSDFEAVIPSKLGAAVATDEPSNTISEGTGQWENVGPAEGPGGLKGFRPINNRSGCINHQFSDPKYTATKGARLSFKFFCTQPQSVVIYGGSQHKAELEITASNDWQEMTLTAKQLLFIHEETQVLSGWEKADSVKLLPAAGSDLTKIVFADFKWVE